MIRQLLEAVHVDLDMLASQFHHGFSEPEVRRVLSWGQAGLERVAGSVKSLAKAIESRVYVGARPEDFQDLVAVQSMPWVYGEQLRQGFRAAPLPAGHGLYHAGVLDIDLEFAKQPHAQQRRCVSVSSQPRAVALAGRRQDGSAPCRKSD
jgi:hypothetical protein